MDLGELKKQLYKKDGQMEGRPSPPEELAPGHQVAPEPALLSNWQDNEQPADFSMQTKKMLWLAGGMAALAAVVIGGWFIWRNLNSFDAKTISLDIFGQERVVSGEEINYIVRYKNNSRAVMNNAVLTFSAPGQLAPSDQDSFVLRGDLLVATKSLGALAPGQEGQAEFKIRVLGDKDSQQKFTAKLSYRPASLNSNFSNDEEFISTIISVPLVLSFILPSKIVSGQIMNLTLRYLNTSDSSFSNAKLKIEYPDGFIFDSALPSPSLDGTSSDGEDNNVWNLPEIGSREEGNIVVKGTIAGNEGESKVFKAQIGTQRENENFVVYSQTLSSPQVSVSPLWVEQSLLNAADTNVTLGQDLTYRIKYRNTTDVAIGPVFITVKIDSQAVDLAAVMANNGFFSSSEDLITWNSSSLPALEFLDAKAEGVVEFSLRLKNSLPVNKFSDKNFTIITTASIDSFNVPLALNGTQLAGQNQLIVKINSRLSLAMKGYYNDRLIPNSGPLPPLVGQKTTYTVYWQVLNVANDVDRIRVEAYLPSYVRWEGNISPTNEDIKYDPSSGKVTWQIGKLAAGAGVLSPVRQVAWQVGLVPSIGQVGNAVVVVKEAKISGEDLFTGATISGVAKELASNMPDDSTVGGNKGRIAQ